MPISIVQVSYVNVRLPFLFFFLQILLQIFHFDLYLVCLHDIPIVAKLDLKNTMGVDSFFKKGHPGIITIFQKKINRTDLESIQNQQFLQQK